MRKLMIAIALLALLSVPVLGANPTDDQCDVDVTINVPEITELYSAIGADQELNDATAPTLEITNAAGVVPEDGIAEDTLYALANTDVDVLVQLDDSGADIPEWTRLHVIVDPQNRGDYDDVGAGRGSTLVDLNGSKSNQITWDRRDADSGYQGNQPGTAIFAFSAASSNSVIGTAVDYVADANMGMPAQGDSTPTLYWTVAPQ